MTKLLKLEFFLEDHGDMCLQGICAFNLGVNLSVVLVLLTTSSG